MHLYYWLACAAFCALVLGEHGPPRKVEMEGLLELVQSPSETYRSPCWQTGSTVTCLPGFFIIGGAKCGTTDLAMRLNKHPLLALSHHKEPHWWTRCSTYRKKPCPSHDNMNALNISLQAYLKNWEHEELVSKNQLAFEASCSTISDFRQGYVIPQLLKRVYREYSSKLKFLLIARNPVARAWSDYVYFKTRILIKKQEKSKAIDLPDPKEFHEWITDEISHFRTCNLRYTPVDCILNKLPQRWDLRRAVIKHGLYHPVLELWLQSFEPTQFLVLSSESYFANTSKYLKQTIDFLGLPEYTKEELSEALMSGIANEKETLLDVLPPATHHHLSVIKMLPETKELMISFHKPFQEKFVTLSRQTWQGTNH
eukprot:m.17544 g.17544  ORF g.17544 m.17544 type:complete len:369 (-) comp6047_c0_seq2:2998-4104(-)